MKRAGLYNNRTNAGKEMNEKQKISESDERESLIPASRIHRRVGQKLR